MRPTALVLYAALIGPAIAADFPTVLPQPGAADKRVQMAPSWQYLINLPYANQLGIFSATGISGRFFGLEASGLAPDTFGTPDLAPGQSFISSAEFEQKMGRAVGVFTVGVLRDSGYMLGSQQGAALAASPTTTFTSVSAGYALTRDLSVVGTASSGRTEGFSGSDSLLAQVTSVRTMAYSVGFAMHRIWNDHDSVGLTFSMPARVQSGTIQLSGAVPQGADTSTLITANQVLNLRPTATERDMEMTYTTRFGANGKRGRLTGSIMWREHPGHDAAAPPDWQVGVRYSYGF